jgi:hypothetical protein
MSNGINMPRLEDIKVGDVFESNVHSDNGDFLTENIFLGKTLVPFYNFLWISKSSGASFTITLKEEDFKLALENGYYTEYKGPRIPPNLLEDIRLPKQRESLEIIENQTTVQINDDVRNHIISLLRKGDNEKIYGGRRKTRKTRKTSRKL